MLVQISLEWYKCQSMIELMSEKAVIVHVSVSFVITGTFLR